MMFIDVCDRRMTIRGSSILRGDGALGEDFDHGISGSACGALPSSRVCRKC
jgi:hypothetical protein